MADNELTDQRGNKVKVNTDNLPENAPARTGKTTPPSGQGGANPHDGISYQDQFPPNPEPSESAAAKGKENDEIGTGDTNPVPSVQREGAKEKK